MCVCVSSLDIFGVARFSIDDEKFFEFVFQIAIQCRTRKGQYWSNWEQYNLGGSTMGSLPHESHWSVKSKQINDSPKPFISHQTERKRRKERKERTLYPRWIFSLKFLSLSTRVVLLFRFLFRSLECSLYIIFIKSQTKKWEHTKSIKITK